MIAFPVQRPPIKVDAVICALVGVLLLAMAVRLYGWNWDDGNYLHPDERHIVADVMIGRIHWPSSLSEVTDPATSGLNPRSEDPNTEEADDYREFAYGAMPVLLTNLVSEALGWFTNTNWHAYDNAYKVGRPLSVIFDTLTVLLVFLIGRRIGGPRVGLLAAYVAALTPLTIQLAHFFTTDSWLTFFVTLSIYCSLRAAESGAARWFLLAGASFGWAMACKGSVFTLASVVAVAIVYSLWRLAGTGERRFGIATAAAERIALVGGAAFLAFAMFEPYALLRPDVYRASLETQAQIVRGTFDVPFTRQYIGTTPIIYQIEQLVRWEVGPVSAVLAAIGAVILLVRQRRGLQAGAILLLTWLAIYGVVISIPEAKFIRYLAPIVPVLAILAGLSLDSIWAWISRRFDRRIGLGFAALAIAGIGLWGASFSSIYAQENTRLEASAWIYANVPTGSVLSDEYWDDQLPRDLGPGLNSIDRQYSSVRFDLYADRVSYRDLMDVADSLTTLPLLEAAGASLRSGDVSSSAEQIRQAGETAISLPVDQRDALSSGFDRIAGDLRGPAGALGGSFRNAAQAIREDPEAIAIEFGDIANELIAANNNEAANYLYRNLEEIDYYVISSNRVMAAMPQSPWRYPVQTKFYEELKSGDLGFTLVADFHRYPGIGPIRFDDDGADESWLNYDHPHVWVYQKTGLVDQPTYDSLMLDARMQEITPERYPDDDLMLDEPVGSLEVVDDARWSAAWTDNSVVALLVWIVLLVVLQLAAWPWARLAFAQFADGGWSFSRLLTLLLAGYIVWLGASTELIAFRAIWAWVAVAVVAAGGWLLRLRWTGFRPGWRQTEEQRRTAAVAELVFWGVFALFLLFRYLNPDSYHPIWGGEKPMEFAHLNATLRSAHFPPFDPWFADGFINYYYFGLYLVAFCLKLTGIPSEIGFNLAQPTVIGLIAMTGYGVAATFGRDLIRRGMAIPAGLAAVLLLVGIGNLDEFFRWLENPDRRDFSYNTWDPIHVMDPPWGTITEFPYFTGLYADLHAHVIALPITILAIALAYALARDTRRTLLALSRPMAERSASIAVVVRCVGLALAVGALFATNAWDVATYFALGVVAIYMGTGAVRSVTVRLGTTVAGTAAIGALAYGLFLPFHQHYVALFSSIGEVREQSNFWEFSRHAGGLFAIVAVALVAWSIRRVDRASLGWSPSVATILFVGAIGLHALLPSDRANLRDAVTSALVVVAIVTLLGSAWLVADPSGNAPSVDGITALRAAIVLVGVVALIAVASDWTVFALMISVAALAAVIWLTDSEQPARFIAVLCAGAAAIVAGTEVIFLVDNLEGGNSYRMNTVFKFYNQVWVLLALAGSALMTWLISTWVANADRGPSRMTHGIVESGDVIPEPDDSERTPARADTRTAAFVGWVQTGAIVCAVVVALSLFYPVLATGPRLDQRFADSLGSDTLNAYDWMDYGTIRTAPDGTLLSFADDRAAIEWFNDEVAGSPVIAEASIGAYRCNGSRISIGTGLPTIIGWLNHETQQRYLDGLSDRENDVRELYETSNVAVKQEILARYGVEYVVVGQLERLGVVQTSQGCTSLPSPGGIAAFEQMVGTTLEVAFQHGDMTVYRVIDSSVGPGA